MQADFCCCCSLIEWFVHAISKDTDFKSSYSIWNPSYYFTNWLKFNADKDILAAKLNLWFYRTYAITIVLTEDSQTVWMERRPFTPSDPKQTILWSGIPVPPSQDILWLLFVCSFVCFNSFIFLCPVSWQQFNLLLLLHIL